MTIESSLISSALIWLVGVFYGLCLVVFRPEWVYSFSDEQYLRGE